MADTATMTPTAGAQPSIDTATPSGPTVTLTYDAATIVNDYPGVAYNATTFTPGAPAMTPA